jgi:hypothetical protein
MSILPLQIRRKLILKHTLESRYHKLGRIFICDVSDISNPPFRRVVANDCEIFVPDPSDTSPTAASLSRGEPNLPIQQYAAG